MPGYLLYALIFALPFGTRKLLFQFTPGFHEYETAFVYGTDVLLVLFLIAVAYAAKADKGNGSTSSPNNTHVFPERSRRATLALFVLLAGVSVFFAPSSGLALYSFVRLALAVAFAAAVAYVLRAGIVRFNTICAAIAASAVFQSLIAFAQFVRQGSVGLWFLGEPALSAHAPGIAKFAVAGGKILRAYGTFPHPNVLGGFLVLGLLSLCYSWLQVSSVIARSEATKQSYIIVRLLRFARNDIFYIIGAYVVLLGLILTFSRTAWLVAILVSIALLLYCFMHNALRRRAFFLLFTLAASGCTLAVIFSPFILSRAQITATEPSVVERLEYNTLGFSLIRQHPFGVGIGSQVLYSVTNGLYQQLGMTQVWQWEPIHDIYLLMAAEVGVSGLLSFIFFIAAILISNYKFPISNYRALSLDIVIARLMLLSLLAFGLVDHFLWTLEPGRLMLWLAIGLAWGVAGQEVQSEVM